MTDRTVDVSISVALSALTLVVALYFAPRGFQSGFVDMGHDGYQLRQVLDLSQGGIIFKDTFDQYGPLNGYLNAVGFMALGRRLLAMKYFMCGWYAVIVVFLYVMARRWLRPPLAALAAAAWLGLAPFYNHGIMISPHAYALLFQAMATIIVLRSDRSAPRAFAFVGLLAGLSWAVKQSMGVFYLAAIVAYLFLMWLLGREEWRRAARAVAVMSLAFCAVVGGFLAFLWAQGALPDWYLQTIAFPRAFYIPAQGSGGPAPAAMASGLFGQAALFFDAQLGQPYYWLVLRGVVLLAALVQLLRRQVEDDLLLMASITLFLWLGAYPSANFMHQWWTASLTFAPFVACVRKPLTRWIRQETAVTRATAAVVLAIVLPGLLARAATTVDRARTLTETLDAPPLYRGIRVDEPTWRAFDMLYRTMSRFRADHPGTRVVSIESADGWRSGIIESLPLLTFFADNTHVQPVYWSLPVLTTTVYPRYGDRLWRQIREDRPLIVDHRNGEYRPYTIAGYRTLAAAESNYGFWYVYAPADATPFPEQRAMYLAADGSTEEIVPGAGAVRPQLARRMNRDVAGAWRGVVRPEEWHKETIDLSGSYRLTVVDPELRKAPRPVNVYTWPANLPELNLTGPLTPVSTDVVWRGGKRDIVRELRPGGWTVDGQAQLPFGYLLQWREEPLDAGTRFVVRGELFEGGLQVGFLERKEWYGFVCITAPGPFEAVVEIQKPGEYGLVAANCIQSTWADRAKAHPIRAMAGLLTGGYLPNRLHVSQAGWMAADELR